MKVADVCEVKVNFVEADFWLIRSHSREEVGRVVKHFNPDFIGVRVVKRELFIPSYVAFICSFHHGRGVFALAAKGSLNLVHISVETVKELSLDVRYW